MVHRIMKKVSCAPAIFFLFHSVTSGQFALPRHKQADENVVQVTGPGNYGSAVTTYMLANDITRSVTTIFWERMLHWILTDLHLNMLMATISTFPIHVLKKMIKDGNFQRLPVQMWSARQMFMFLSPKKIMSLKKGDEIILPMSGCLFQTAPILPCAMKIRLYVDYELAKGAGSISIKNGIIESAAGGILSGGEARNIRAFYGSRKSIRLLK